MRDEERTIVSQTHQTRVLRVKCPQLLCVTVVEGHLDLQRRKVWRRTERLYCPPWIHRLSGRSSPEDAPHTHSLTQLTTGGEDDSCCWLVSYKDSSSHCDTVYHGSHSAAKSSSLWASSSLCCPLFGWWQRGNWSCNSLLATLSPCSSFC